MNATYALLTLGATPVLLLLAGPATPPKRYVQVTAAVAPVYAVKVGGGIIGKVRRGTVLKLDEDAGSSWKVFLFSGETRYMNKTAAKPAEYKPMPPADEGIRQQVFAALVATERKSQEDADRAVPPAQVHRNIELMRILDDRYKLEVMQRFKLDPPLYTAIIVEGAQKRLEGLKKRQPN